MSFCNHDQDFRAEWSQMFDGSLDQALPGNHNGVLFFTQARTAATGEDNRCHVRYPSYGNDMLTLVGCQCLE